MEKGVVNGIVKPKYDWAQPNLSEKIIDKFGLLEQLFEAFHEHNILYCHWKSNEHLGAGLSGDTDLDLLFNESQKEQVCELMVHYGFKHFKAVNQKRYDGIEDFLSIDFTTGRLYHLHSHFKLTLGENYLKSYQLNLEKLVLGSRVFDEDYQVYCTHPALELVLLFIRSSFKLRMRDRLKIYFGKSLQCAPSSVIEYNWLKERCTDKEVMLFLEKIFADPKRIFGIIKGGFNKKQMLALSKIVKTEFRKQRLLDPFEALYKRWNRELSLSFLRNYAKLTNEPVVVKRINPVDGLSIAIVGPDGAGKSTIIENLEYCFRTKLDVYSIYFGKGGGRMSWYRRLLMLMRYRTFIRKANVRAVKDKIAIKNSGDRQKKKQGIMSTFFSITEALMVQNEKLNNYRLLKKAKENGMLVICDRYPQNQVKGFNDGPTLHQYISGSTRFSKCLVEREEKAYSFLQNNPPDIVFRLVADIEVIAARKPGETSIEMLRKKQDAFMTLTYPDSCKVIEVNANQPLAVVLEVIRKNIWKEIR